MSNEDGNRPVLKIEGETLPEVWEKSVIETWEKGIAIKTEYDKEEDPPSRDCTMVMNITNPMKEPRIHRAFPGGLEDLEIYRQEVLNGVHDHWINPEEGKWAYTYHERLHEFKFQPSDEAINQINYIIDYLSKTPYSRRAQAITWDPKTDPGSRDPPCLQNLWCRIFKNNEGKYVLNMNTLWRSRDAYKAAFMNMFALTGSGKLIAEKVSEKIREEVLVGSYVDVSWSYHIYGSYFKEFEENFLKNIKKREFKDRIWTTEAAKPFFHEGIERLLKDKNMPENKRIILEKELERFR